MSVNDRNNAFLELRARCAADSCRPYRARGAAVVRCQRCLVVRNNCICGWRVPLHASLDVALLLHHDEIFKPTNTGRLVVDILPDQCAAYEWQRQAPPPALCSRLQQDPDGVAVLFPADVDHPAVNVPQLRANGARPLLIVLDGTWRQASRMFRLSPWLRSLPVLRLNTDVTPGYRVRQAPHPGQLSTAEAVAGALRQFGENEPARVLTDYFQVFNSHYVASRQQRLPDLDTEAHRRLAARMA